MSTLVAYSEEQLKNLNTYIGSTTTPLARRLKHCPSDTSAIKQHILQHIVHDKLTSVEIRKILTITPKSQIKITIKNVYEFSKPS